MKFVAGKTGESLRKTWPDSDSSTTNSTWSDRDTNSELKRWSAKALKSKPLGQRTDNRPISYK